MERAPFSLCPKPAILSGCFFVEDILSLSRQKPGSLGEARSGHLRCPLSGEAMIGVLE